MSLRRCACGSLWCEARNLCPAGERNPWGWGMDHRVAVDCTEPAQEAVNRQWQWQYDRDHWFGQVPVVEGRDEWGSRIDAIVHQHLRAAYERINRERREA